MATERNDINWQELKQDLEAHLVHMIQILQKMSDKLEVDTDERRFLEAKITAYQLINDELKKGKNNEDIQRSLIKTLSLHDELLTESKRQDGNFHPPLDFFGKISDFMMKHKIAILTTVLIVVGTALAVTPLGMAMAGAGLGVLGLKLIMGGGIMAVIGCFIPAFARDFGPQDGQESLAGLSTRALSEGSLFKGKHEDIKEVQGEELNIQTAPKSPT